MCQNFIIPYLYEAHHVSGDTPPIIRSLKLHWKPLVFHTWKVVWACSWWTLSGTVCLMGGMSSETCWASYKCGIIKFWYIVASCWIFLYKFYYYARIHERQVYGFSSKNIIIFIPNIFFRVMSIFYCTSRKYECIGMCNGLHNWLQHTFNLVGQVAHPGGLTSNPHRSAPLFSVQEMCVDPYITWRL